MSGGWTTRDIPDQTGRTVVVTGANSGIGFELAKALADRGAHVVLAVRNLDKGKDACARIVADNPRADLALQQLDLASLASIRSAADDLRSAYPTIDLLINNAGVFFTPKSTTADGFEMQFGTNYLGHFALTGLLVDRLLSVQDSRVVTMSSLAHKWGSQIHFDDLQWQRHYHREGAYGQSKLANLMFTFELQRRLAPKNATIAVAAHPGMSSSHLNQHAPLAFRLATTPIQLYTQSAAMGALPALQAATDPGVLGGQYYGPGRFFETRGKPRLARPSALSLDESQQRRLWSVAEQLTQVTYPL